MGDDYQQFRDLLLIASSAVMFGATLAFFVYTMATRRQFVTVGEGEVSVYRPSIRVPPYLYRRYPMNSSSRVELVLYDWNSGRQLDAGDVAAMVAGAGMLSPVPIRVQIVGTSQAPSVGVAAKYMIIDKDSVRAVETLD
ncbi:MAG: hypothetical protein AAGD35_04910 [Actinomycetota bacterium]